ncbi:uncharacterized protein EV154DRAFT_488633 [Mucor mucedo]|uniref:uncharacterized protein n=1 Tax=Mucor mucedo TaxID=29922 RepID=UPI002220BF43|nr:uncharacterized protein EV154DRAFT_488633 [Mucor mucedo]KAI7865997.1 hypothetical protein EV154DRAFT_488633 [Mucor mucedo]
MLCSFDLQILYSSIVGSRKILKTCRSSHRDVKLPFLKPKMGDFFKYVIRWPIGQPPVDDWIQIWLDSLFIHNDLCLKICVLSMQLSTAMALALILSRKIIFVFILYTFSMATWGLEFQESRSIHNSVHVEG